MSHKNLVNMLVVPFFLVISFENKSSNSKVSVFCIFNIVLYCIKNNVTKKTAEFDLNYVYN